MNNKITYSFIYKLIIKLLEFYWDFSYHFGLQITKHSFKNNSKAQFQESISLLLTMVISKNMFFSQFPPNLVNNITIYLDFLTRNSRIKIFILYPIVDPLSIDTPWYYHIIGNHIKYIVFNDQRFD